VLGVVSRRIGIVEVLVEAMLHAVALDFDFPGCKVVTGQDQKIFAVGNICERI
jgi:hypothetical protein